MPDGFYIFDFLNRGCGPIQIKIFHFHNFHKFDFGNLQVSFGSDLLFLHFIVQWFHLRHLFIGKPHLICMLHEHHVAAHHIHIAPFHHLSMPFSMPMKGHGEGHGQMMERGNMDMMGGDMMFMEHANKMGLTDEQMAKMKPLHNEMQKKQIRSKADLKIAEIELMEIMEVKDFDLDRATSAVKKIEDIKTVRHLGMLKAMKDMRAILTDEQFKNMQKMCMMKMGEEEHEKKMDKSKHTKKNQSHKKTAADMKDMKH